MPRALAWAGRLRLADAYGLEGRVGWNFRRIDNRNHARGSDPWWSAVAEDSVHGRSIQEPEDVFAGTAVAVTLRTTPW